MRKSELIFIERVNQVCKKTELKDHRKRGQQGRDNSIGGDSWEGAFKVATHSVGKRVVTSNDGRGYDKRSKGFKVECKQRQSKVAELDNDGNIIGWCFDNADYLLYAPAPPEVIPQFTSDTDAQKFIRQHGFLIPIDAIKAYMLANPAVCNYRYKACELYIRIQSDRQLYKFFDFAEAVHRADILELLFSR